MTTPAELRSQLEVQGAEVSLLVQQIEDRIEELRDWRTMVDQKPIVSVGMAVGAGLLVSGVAFPLFVIMGRQAGIALKVGLTAFITAKINQKFQQYI